MKRAVLVLGTLEYEAARVGQCLTDFTYELLNTITTSLDIKASVVFVIEDPYFAGRTKSKLSIKQIRAERARVLDEIGNAHPDYVFCLGPVASTCVFNRGNIVESDMLRREHRPLGEDGPPVFVTYGIENLRARAGLSPWLEMDMRSAIEGMTKTEWGEYVVLLPDTPGWRNPPSVYLDMLRTAEPDAPQWIGFDLETYPGLSPWDPKARIRMVILSHAVGHATIVQLPLDSVMPDWVYSVLRHPWIVKCGSNIKFDYLWTRRFGCIVQNMWDTSTHEHIINESNPKKDLKSLTFRYVPKLSDYAYEQRNLVKQRGGWENIEDHEMYQYAGADGEASIGTALEQAKIIKRKKLERPAEMMRAVYNVLCDMEYAGACVFMEENRKLDKLYEEKLTVLREQIVTYLGPINLNSPPQLAEALKRTIPTINLTLNEWKKAMSDDETEEASTKREVLERESHKHASIPLVLDYRRYRNRHSAYIQRVHEKHAICVGKKHFIHPSFNTAIVETYRLSSTNPNGQNFPRKDKDDARLTVKRQFVSRFRGGSICEGDESQLEIRTAGWLSRDKNLWDAIASGEDIHRAMASRLLSKPTDQITDHERSECKRQTFLILYGGGAYKLSREGKIPLQKAKDMISQYFDTFPRLGEFIDKVHRDVVRSSEIETPFGFRRRFIKPTHWKSKEGASIQRQAFSMAGQNTAAGIVYAAMVEFHQLLNKYHMNSRLILQIHDSLVVDVFPGEEQDIAEFLVHSMTDRRVFLPWGVDIDIPLKCDIGIGPNWGELKEITHEPRTSTKLQTEYPSHTKHDEERYLLR